MYVKGFGVTDVVGAPDAVDQLSAGQHPAGVAEQVLEEVELLERQRHRVTGDLHDVTLDVHPHRSGLEHPVVGGEIRLVLHPATQHRTDAGDQLARRIRFGHIVVRTEFEADDLVDLTVTRRHHDDGNAGARSQRLADVGATHAGQHEVEQDDVRSGAIEFRQRRRSVVDDGGLEAFLAEQERQRVRQGLLVLHDQHTRHRLASMPFSLLPCSRLPIRVEPAVPASSESMSSSDSTCAGICNVKVDPVPGLLHSSMEPL